MRINYNVKHRCAIRLNYGDKLTSLTKTVLKVKASICSTTKENLFFYCRKFSVCVVVVIN